MKLVYNTVSLMDYVEIVEQMLSFDNVTRRRCYTVTIQDDDVPEFGEDFLVTYTPPTRVAVIPSMTTVRIRDIPSKWL